MASSKLHTPLNFQLLYSSNQHSDKHDDDIKSEHFVSVPSLEFASYVPYKARAVLTDSLIIMNTIQFPMEERISDNISRSLGWKALM